MKYDHFVVQSPATPAQQLVLLFHGVGDNHTAMGEGIGRYFAEAFPEAMVVSIGGPYPHTVANGRQWFSVAGITDENRQARVDEAMPLFVEAVREWQTASGVMPAATALIGFSQGAIMALESTKLHPGLASRIVAFNGRFATVPQQATTATTIHMINGDEDKVIEGLYAFQAQEALIAAGGDMTLDMVEGLGHAINDRSMELALNHLRYTVPKHYFDEALSGGKPDNDDLIEMI
ncbi:esterase [Salmonella enterica subsp. enterica serovar Choleraesuis]|nr:esterase [Salmonella enterica subsp. enterica serovar Choleraesuis]